MDLTLRIIVSLNYCISCRPSFGTDNEGNGTDHDNEQQRTNLFLYVIYFLLFLDNLWTVLKGVKMAISVQIS